MTNVVFMGMGEPFHNYDETLRACRLLNDETGFNLAARSISVSTVGVVPGIDRFAEEPLQLNLAVSLHAATDELRDRLVPLNRTYPLDEVFARVRAVRAAHPPQGHVRVRGAARGERHATSRRRCWRRACGHRTITSI